MRKQEQLLNELKKLSALIMKAKIGVLTK